MACPNCGSSKVRRSRRNTAEKIFLTMLVTRPFRCEDCIGRFFSWLWQPSAVAGPDADKNSLVYRSPTAALHSSVHRSRKKGRTATAASEVPQPRRAPIRSLVGAWLTNPIQQRSANTPAAARVVKVSEPQVVPDPQRDSLPEILGVILEMKHQAS